MTNEYKEKIVCNKCSKVFFRDAEIIETSGTLIELESPLNIIIIKKHICDKCKINDVTIDLVKNKEINRKVV